MTPTPPNPEGPAASGPMTEFDPGVLSDSASCPFCRIVAAYPPYDPAVAPASDSDVVNPEAISPEPATFVVLSTPLVIAFLDIMPLSQGHLLLCTRAHRPKLSDVTPAESLELGRYLPILSSAVVQATDIKDWNVVQNNGAAAAQVVPHMHFHIIPRPDLKDARRERFTATMFGRGARQELDEEEATPLAEKVRQAVAQHIKHAEGKHKL